MKKIVALALLFSFSLLAQGNTIVQSRELQLFTLNQNTRVAPPTVWWPMRRVNVGSYMNFDIIPKTMQKTMAGEEQDYLALSNVGVNVDARVTRLLNAHLGLAYYKTNKGQGDRYRNTGLLLDDAYMDAYNFAASPFFAQAGLFYLPFGDNDRRAIEPSLVQVLTITREAGVEVGVVDWYGFTAALYFAQGQLKDNNKKIQGGLNYGTSLNYHYHAVNSFIFKAGLDYIYNMLYTNALAESPAFSNPQVASNQYSFSNKTPGVAANMAVGYGPVVLIGRYVTALHGSSDLVRYYQTMVNGYQNPVYGARPSAWDVGFIVSFKVYGKQTHASYTYSRSRDCAGLPIFNTSNYHGMPLSRYILGYTVQWNKNFFTTFEWGHNWLYPVGKGDEGRQGDNATIRLGLTM